MIIDPIEVEVEVEGRKGLKWKANVCDLKIVYLDKPSKQFKVPQTILVSAVFQLNIAQRNIDHTLESLRIDIGA